MFQILLSEFWEDLRTQRTRVLLTSTGIACGTFIVVVLLALGEGVKREVMTEVLGSYEDAISVRGGFTTMPYRGLPARRRIPLEEADVQALLTEVKDIEVATAVYTYWGIRLSSESSRLRVEGQVQGVDDGFARMKKVEPAPGGRFLNERDIEERRRVVFLADSLARLLFPAGDALGNTVRLKNQPFTVIGIAPRVIPTIDGVRDEDLAIIPSTTFRAIYNARAPSLIMLRASDPQDSKDVQDGIRRVLSERHRFDPADRQAIWINDYAADAKEAWRILTGIQVFMGMVGGLTLLVAAVGVANIMYVAVKERTREVGIKLALGARSKHIVAQFVFEAVLLSVSGGIAGLAAAGIAVAIMNGVKPENEALQYLMKPVISWNIGFATILILTAIGFMAGVFPARRAAGLDPAESLRYE